MAPKSNEHGATRIRVTAVMLRMVGGDISV
jgi:hypothetical protein